MAQVGKVLGVVYRVLATHLIHKAGYTHKTANTGSVTLIQRFGGALNLNVHFHMLLPKPMNAINWNVFVATLPALPYLKSACH